MSAGAATAGSPVKPQLRDLKRAGIAIEGWLRDHVDSTIHVTDVSTPGSAGVANETLIVETNGPRYVVRVDAAEHLFMGMDLDVHYRMYSTLADEPGIPVPAVHGFEADRAILGERFFVMEWVEGRVPPDRPNFNRSGWLKEASVQEREAIWRDTVALMARFHALPPSRFSFLLRPELGTSGLEQEVGYWLGYADRCGADRHPLLAHARHWLGARLPDPAPTSPSWGDARLQNVMVRGTRCVAMFDWDMVSLAGPEADLAWWALADHKYTYSQGIERLAGIGSPADTIALWEQLSGRKVRDMEWHLVFASYRQALISIRLPQLTRTLQGLATDADAPIPASAGLQWLSCLLDQPLGEPITMPFVGLDK
jgi:aminoglycoside phosphotransferase (APT) family kinase protein